MGLDAGEDQERGDNDPGCEWNSTLDGVMSFCDAPFAYLIGEYHFCSVHGLEILSRRQKEDRPPRE
jgi:hypothetical protein